ncbi:MAG: ParB/RepB/Spo0J family partition protein [bacterium]|nr:ParB/RepB/Spo0J family partition protein [bacterium]
MSLGKGLESLIPPSQGSGRKDDNVPPNFPPNVSETRKSGVFGDEPTGFRHVGDIDRGVGPLGQKPTLEFRKSEGLESSKSSTGQAPSASSGQAVFQIEISKIKPNPHQPRREFNNELLGELAASIREFGILQPLVVTKVEIETPTGTDVQYTLIAGERRLMAAKIAGLPTVPAIIRNIGLERERLEMAIIENLQRENLNPIERGRAFARLQDEFNLTQREIATRLGKSRAAVANTMRLLDLPSYIQTALSSNQISESHGRLLLGVEDEKSRERIFKDLVGMKLTTRELKGKVAKTRDGDLSITIDLSPEIKMFQEELTAQLGAPVKIDHKGEGGRITITFYSDEELQSIIDRFKKDAGEDVGW